MPTLILILALLTASDAVMVRAEKHLPVLERVESRYWPGMPLREIVAGQIEQESGWRDHATLNTSRELGRGLTQITIAYDKAGNERFNNFEEAVKFPPLKGWNWKDDPFNARYQMTYLILQDHANFVRVSTMFKNNEQAWMGTLVSYNAGIGRVLQRRAVARYKGIPSDRWENGLDGAHAASEDAILYGRPLWQTVNEYPRVIFEKSKKYRKEQ